MRIHLNGSNEVEAIIEIDAQPSSKHFDFPISQKIFNKMHRFGELEDYKKGIKSRLITMAVQKVQDEIFSQVSVRFEEEWSALMVAIPTPVFIEEPEEPTVRQRAKRCSRQMDLEELEAWRNRLMEQMNQL